MDIQIYSEEWAEEIADLFYQSVHAIDSSVYTLEQKTAWAPAPIDYGFWSRRLSEKMPLIAISENRVAGFMEMDDSGHIDVAYTHPDFQGKGVASTLYGYLLRGAKNKNIDRLYVEASLVAKPFFEHRGFSVVKKNEVQRNGVLLVNFSMEKRLSSDINGSRPEWHVLKRNGR
ncbi:GNAT family N-acetyltransferase [Alkalimarinus coralli]|uniref:GNAT family N-acetyltransferase n=1 Tax=Alkalimarinus coralli TaxID=2935863 RepID=UPI00202B9E3C|nr:GNAT family N-acetyltransferase [Alkalimarinus coralli]